MIGKIDKKEHLDLIGKSVYEFSLISWLFSPKDRLLLEKYGAWMDALANGKISPFTTEQERFIRVSKGLEDALTDFEKVWVNMIKIRKFNLRGSFSGFSHMSWMLDGKDRLLLEEHGAWMAALASGKIPPFTTEQERFIRVSKGLEDALTDFEKAWVNMTIKIRKRNLRGSPSRFSYISWVLSTKDRLILEEHGAWMEALASGKIPPFTTEEERFVRVSKGLEDALTDFEKAWVNMIKKETAEYYDIDKSRPQSYAERCIQNAHSGPPLRACPACGMVNDNCTCGRD